MSTSVEEVLEVLEFYARGVSDGGHRARQLLDRLNLDIQTANPGVMDSARALMGFFSAQYKIVCGHKYKPGKRDVPLLASLIRQKGPALSRKLMSSTISEWGSLRLGPLTVQSLVEQVMR